MELSAEPFIAVVTGMHAEARIASRFGGVRTIAGGGDTARLVSEIDRAAADGARAILSFGIAGGLCPDLVPGSIVVAREVADGHDRLQTCPRWSTQFLTLIPDAHHGVLAGTDAPIVSVEAKRALNVATRAVAVDMESHIAARRAAAHDVPFAALRVVADSAHRALPQAALAGFGSDGNINILGVMRALLRRPYELPALVRLSADTRAAFASLLRCGGRLSSEPTLGRIAPGLGLVDLG